MKSYGGLGMTIQRLYQKGMTDNIMMNLIYLCDNAIDIYLTKDDTSLPSCTMHRDVMQGEIMRLVYSQCLDDLLDKISKYESGCRKKNISPDKRCYFSDEMIENIYIEDKTIHVLDSAFFVRAKR